MSLSDTVALGDRVSRSDTVVLGDRVSRSDTVVLGVQSVTFRHGDNGSECHGSGTIMIKRMNLELC